MAFKFKNHCATGYKNLRASNHYNSEAQFAKGQAFPRDDIA